MLGVDGEAVRLFLHVLGATVWVGGQLVLAALVPALRRFHPEAPGVVARGFARVAWPAFALLVGTGIWNLVAIDDEPSAHTAAYGHTLTLKLAFVVLSGVGAGVHQHTRSRALLAAGGAVAGLGALGALLLGIVLAR